MSHHQNNINNFRPKSAMVTKQNNFKNVTPILSSRLVNNFVNNNVAEQIIKKEVDEKLTVLVSDVKKYFTILFS